MRPAHASPETVPIESARRLFLHAQGLLDDPARRADAGSVYRLVERLGFVQIDSIRIVERAHHLILAARLDGYRPQHLQRLLEDDRRLFEHWTHDAAAIPSTWFPHWRCRFDRHRTHILGRAWWLERLGDDHEKMLAHVRERIAREGPLQSKDFEHDRQGASGGWWGWKPQKAALEYLWHTGELGIARRVHFQKVYDLVERILPDVAPLPATDPEAHTDWACRSALDRLGIASARELCGFWRALDLETTQRWCDAALARGEIVAVTLRADGMRDQTAYAPARLAATAAPRARRSRTLARAGALRSDPSRPQAHPAALRFRLHVRGLRARSQTRYGYYVLPILENDRLVGRLDPAPRRAGKSIRARKIWWEEGVRPTRARRAGVEAALERLSASIDRGT
jgi:uncharacterized protein YcaQ